MMQIDLYCIGKIKEKYLKQGMDEYLKRLSAYAKVKVHELADEATSENLSDQEKILLLEKEAQRLSNHLDRKSKIVVLAIEGELLSSEQMAQQLDHFATYGSSKISFIIGGSLGLSEEIKKQADVSWSLGRITLPHQLIRLVLLEQIYRVFRIDSGHAYHK